LRIAVIDSSPLIHLAHLELAQELIFFFDLIYVPSAVQREVNRKQRFRYRLKKLYGTGVFKRCASAAKDRVELLMAELHEGEAEALVQAQERNATYFIGDEKRAREIGQDQGLALVGTLRILARLHLQGQAQETTKLVKKLRKDLKFRVTDEIVEQAIAMAGEAI
jgi:predicted nucleic acid-binding protein